MTRREDPGLLSGEARFVDDLVVPGALHVGLVRSPHANARIRSVDASAALALPGVVAAFSGADLRDEWAQPLPCAWPVTPEMLNPAHLPLAVEHARYAGDAVAAVVAESAYVAEDAAALVAVDYDVLPAVVDLEDAVADRALVHPELSTNTAYTWELLQQGRLRTDFQRLDLGVGHHVPCHLKALGGVPRSGMVMRVMRR